MTPKKLILFSLAMHLVYALFSTGFHHWDEHFQILEFLNYKLELSPSSDLPWEFTEGMRPFIQPFFYYLLVKPSLLLGGIFTPHLWAFVFRLWAAILGFYSLFVLYKKRNTLIEKSYTAKILLPLLLFSTWYLPYIHARHSAEGLGGSLFMIGLASFLSKKESRWEALEVGLLFGLSFLMRFHLGFMILFLYLWSLFFDGLKWKRFWLHSLVIVLTISLGVLVDRWGYGEWTFSPWNYVVQNLFEGKVSNFGVNPWYDYFKSIFRKSFPPLGILTLISFFWLWIKKPKHLLTWISLPFFLVHLLIGHKELRFLFPLVAIIPFVWVLFIEEYKRYWGPWWKNGFKIVWIFNLLYLLTMAFKPAHISHDYFKAVRGLEIPKLHIYGDTNPYFLAKLKVNYFGVVHPKIKMLSDDSDPALILLKNETSWFFSNRGKFFHKLKQFEQCQLVFSNYPEWLLMFGGRPMKWQTNSKAWTLVKCQIKF